MGGTRSRLVHDLRSFVLPLEVRNLERLHRLQRHVERSLCRRRILGLQIMLDLPQRPEHARADRIAVLRNVRSNSLFRLS